MPSRARIEKLHHLRPARWLRGRREVPRRTSSRHRGRRSQCRGRPSLPSRTEPGGRGRAEDGSGRQEIVATRVALVGVTSDDGRRHPHARAPGPPPCRLPWPAQPAARRPGCRRRRSCRWPSPPGPRAEVVAGGSDPGRGHRGPALQDDPAGASTGQGSRAASAVRSPVRARVPRARWGGRRRPGVAGPGPPRLRPLHSSGPSRCRRTSAAPACTGPSQQLPSAVRRGSRAGEVAGEQDEVGGDGAGWDVADPVVGEDAVCRRGTPARGRGASSAIEMPVPARRPRAGLPPAPGARARRATQRPASSVPTAPKRRCCVAQGRQREGDVPSGTGGAHGDTVDDGRPRRGWASR